LNTDKPPSDTELAPVNILLVEDNKIDARLTCNALRQIPDWPAVVRVLDDGEKAVNFFRRPSSIEDGTIPDLVILDMNLPKYDGVEVLQVIRSISELRHLLVFVFSSSPVDVSQERFDRIKLKADSYFEKPNQAGSFITIAARIRDTYRSAGMARRSTTA